MCTAGTGGVRGDPRGGVRAERGRGISRIGEEDREETAQVAGSSLAKDAQGFGLTHLIPAASFARIH